MKKNKHDREFNEDDTCPQCGEPFLSGQDKDGDPKFWCDNCSKKNNEEE